MSLAVFYKLFAIVLTVALGWAAGRMRWLGDANADPARVLGNAAFYIFVPALLFRTTARLDFAGLPWLLLLAFFVPLLVFMMVIYFVARWRQRNGAMPVAAPAVRAICASFGNTVQVGIPVAAAVFGETGLGLHITVVSLHALVLLTVLKTLVELDLAHARARDAMASGSGSGSLAATLKLTLRNTIIHPVVLPVLAGLLYNGVGLRLPVVVDEVLLLLASAVVPLCLVLIGMSLAYYGLPKRVHGAMVVSVLKLLVQPLVVLVCARWMFGISGLPLSVIVMLAALPVGSNALLFSQRYRALEDEATAAIVFSTLAYALTAPLWLAVLSRVPG